MLDIIAGSPLGCMESATASTTYKHLYLIKVTLCQTDYALNVYEIMGSIMKFEISVVFREQKPTLV